MYLYSSGLSCRQMHLHITILLSYIQLECAKHTTIIASTEIGLNGNHSKDLNERLREKIELCSHARLFAAFVLTKGPLLEHRFRKQVPEFQAILSCVRNVSPEFQPPNYGLVKKRKKKNLTSCLKLEEWCKVQF